MNRFALVKQWLRSQKDKILDAVKYVKEDSNANVEIDTNIGIYFKLKHRDGNIKVEVYNSDSEVLVKADEFEIDKDGYVEQMVLDFYIVTTIKTLLDENIN